jgi:hypothetical protein
MSGIKGFPSRIRNRLSDVMTQYFASVVPTDPLNRAGLDVLPKAVAKVDPLVKTAETVTPSDFPLIKNPKLRIIKLTGHSFRVGDAIRFNTGNNINLEIPVIKVTTDYLYLGGELISDPDGDDFFHIRHITLTITKDGSLETSEAIRTVVDQLDDVMIDPSDIGFNSGNGIPASSGTPVQVVASLASNVKRIHVLDDIGEFIGLYDGTSDSDLLCILPQGYTGAILDIEISSGTTLYLRNMKDAAITTDTRIGINFIG